MSGEYYCFEELGESSNYLEGHGVNDNRSEKLDFHDVSHSGDHDNHSNSTKKSQGTHLTEIEEELQKAENRCNKLKSQLDFMKQNYQTTTPRDLLQSRNKDWTPKRSKRQRKRLELPSTPHLQNGFYEGSSVSPSSPAVVIEDSKPKPLPLRQNSNSISTDNSGAAVKTINNIFNGITDTFNRLSHEKDYNLQYAYVEQPFSKDLAAISGKPFSPRLKNKTAEA